MCMNVVIDRIPSTFSDGLLIVLIRQYEWEIEACGLPRIRRVATIEEYPQEVCFGTLWENEESPGEEERHKSISERLIRWSGLIDSTLVKALGICKIKWGSTQVMLETKAVYIQEDSLFPFTHDVSCDVSYIIAEPLALLLVTSLATCDVIGHSTKVMQLLATDVFGLNIIPFGSLRQHFGTCASRIRWSFLISPSYQLYPWNWNSSEYIFRAWIFENSGMDQAKNSDVSFSIFLCMALPYLAITFTDMQLAGESGCKYCLRNEEASVIIRLYRYRKADCWEMSARAIECLVCRCLAFFTQLITP